VRITEAGADALTQPLLRPSVYSSDAIAAAYRDHSLKMKDDGRMLRLKCEIALRRALRMDCPKCVADSAAAGEVQLPPEDEPDADGSGDDGSDSEPSVDNIPTAKLLGKKGAGAMKSTKSLMAALYKAARKRRKATEAAAAKREKKRQAEVLEAAAEVAAAAAAALSANQSTPSKKTPSQPTTPSTPSEAVRVLRGSRERIPLMYRSGSNPASRLNLAGNNADEGLGIQGVGGVVPPGIIMAPGSDVQRLDNGRHTVNRRAASARQTRRSLSSLPVQGGGAGAGPEPQKVVNIVSLTPDGPFQPYNPYYEPGGAGAAAAAAAAAGGAYGHGGGARHPHHRRPSGGVRGFGIQQAQAQVQFTAVPRRTSPGAGTGGGRNHTHRAASPHVLPAQLSFATLCKAVERLAEQLSNEDRRQGQQPTPSSQPPEYSSKGNKQSKG
jgi:hypothetical protein